MNLAPKEAVVDLSVCKGLVQNPSLDVTPLQESPQISTRRVLRPREMKSYAETPDIVILAPKTTVPTEDSDIENEIEAPVVKVRSLYFVALNPLDFLCDVSHFRVQRNNSKLC